MPTTSDSRQLTITPSNAADPVLEAFLRTIDPQADIAAYVHEREPIIKPHTEVLPTDHQMGDGRTAYVFRMGRPAHCQRDFIVVVTSVCESRLASLA